MQCSDVLLHIMHFLRFGAWHAPLRLVCKEWSNALGPIPMHQAPSSPFSEAIIQQSQPLLDWLAKNGVPWTLHAVQNCFRLGRLPAVLWLRTVRPAVFDCLELGQREELTRCVIQGGLSQLLRVPDDDPTLGGMLTWSDSMLGYLFRYFGPLRGTSWQALWERMLVLCNGWNSQALLAAIQFAPLEAIVMVAQHPQARRYLGNRRCWQRCVIQTGLRREAAVFGLVSTMIDADGGILEFTHTAAWELPWGALELAVKHHNQPFVAAFLAHPRRPASVVGAHVCTAAAVLRLRHPDVTTNILRLLVAAGIPWHPQIALIAVDSAHPRVVEWLLQQGTANHVEPEDLLLRSILAGHVETFDVVVAHLGNHLPSPSNPLYMATAAEMGHQDILVRLKNLGFRWDERVIRFALLNGHIRLAQWALDNKCPVVSANEDEGTVAGIREMVRQTLRRN